MIKFYEKFTSTISNIFENFILFILAINTFFTSILTHFIAFISSFGKFFYNFEFIIFGVFLQVLFYFLFFYNSYVDLSNEAIWFFCLFTVSLLLISYFNSSSYQKISVNFLELKIKSIENQLSLNFQINQEISAYNAMCVNYNTSSSFFILNLHIIAISSLANFSNFENLTSRLNFIIDESFSKQISYFIKVVDFKEDQFILASINDLLLEVVSEVE